MMARPWIELREARGRTVKKMTIFYDKEYCARGQEAQAQGEAHPDAEARGSRLMKDDTVGKVFQVDGEMRRCLVCGQRFLRCRAAQHSLEPCGPFGTSKNVERRLTGQETRWNNRSISCRLRVWRLFSTSPDAGFSNSHGLATCHPILSAKAFEEFTDFSFLKSILGSSEGKSDA
jgi:hypothetical protein